MRLSMNPNVPYARQNKPDPTLIYRISILHTINPKEKEVMNN